MHRLWMSVVLFTASVPLLTFADINEDLLIAAQFGTVDEVQTLLNAGADVNAKNRFGDTALKNAKENGHIEIVDLLLQAGAEE